MREDQLTKLQNLSEGLADVVISETDPAGWPGAGKPLSELTKDERGDRYWTKKNAAATMTLLLKVVNISNLLAGNRKPPAADQEQELDDELAAAEREAVALLERAQQGGHVH
ncbi:hypothetical protein [Pseudomonas sp.]|uniref:hypothetical protein n=1 Tax=Pseudomonas sp. TaxID=306 RepID=UPI002579BCEA|nr:hypothetical protein [Pseudomonas sp.]